MKKNSVLTFLFAFIPGAGQMYLGMMKKGTSLMLAFALITAITGFLNLPILAIFLPVLWFYSFFDTFNLNGLSYEERLHYEDKFLFELDGIFKKDWVTLLQKRHVLAGGACIVLGIYMLFNNILFPFLQDYFEYYQWISRVLHAVPTFVVAVAVIALGMHLVLGGKKKAAPPEDDFIEYGGKNDHEG